MTTETRILLIEDDRSLATGLLRIFESEGMVPTHEARGDDGLRRALEADFDVVVTDLKMPGLSGLELVRKLHAAKPRLPIILITAHGTTETAIEATKFGAFDYLLKPFEMEELLGLVESAATASHRMSSPVELGVPAPDRDSIVGSGRVMQAIYKEVGRVAARAVPVLIRGETGTGKELIARAIYQHSDRAAAPFIAINCAAIPETLLESELYGHERGAFTGAEARRIGRFEQAHGGTLFLDEIGDMTAGTQVKLLRVLQENTIQRLGGRETIPVDVRIIAATHRDLEAAMKERQFREDLYYRLSVVVIQLPALRDRREDIPELTRYLLRKRGLELGAADTLIQPEAIELLQAQAWPGNVRELENTVRKLLLVARGFAIDADHVRQVLSRSTVQQDAALRSLRESARELLAQAQRGETLDARARLLDMADREIFAQAIELAAGNQAQAARLLGVSRLTTREKLTEFGMHPTQSLPRAK